MVKYFGTDGIRGIFGEKLTENLAYKAGYAIGKLFGKDILIGRDTRVSGKILEKNLCMGICDAGANAVLVGILPTPAVSFLVKKYNLSAGVILTASHNPPEYNGIKVFNSLGAKPTSSDETRLEQIIDEEITEIKQGKIIINKKAKNEYIEHIVKLSKNLDINLKGLKIVLDCAYGASFAISKPIFKKLGSEVILTNAENLGEKINVDCGAACPEFILAETKKHNAVLGFAYDGDADRVSVCYNGEIIDGDSILYNLSKAIKLTRPVVVGTVLTNLGLEEKLKENGIQLIRTAVGDKYICDEMLKNDYNLGGEQSGHFIISPINQTGDGILSSLLFSKVVFSGKFEKLKLWPQDAIAIEIDKTILEDIEFKNLIKAAEKLLGGSGRLVARYSGTEPKIRVMCEAIASELVDEVLLGFKTFLNSKKQ